MSNNLKTLLIGAGPIALEYAKVLTAMRVPFDVVGRGEKSAAAFTAATCLPVFTGSVQEYVASNGIPGEAIIAVSMDQLARTTKNLIALGAKHILVEKPAGINADEVRSVGSVAAENDAKVFVAYNRRFYASVIKARELIKEDGGVKSFHFEFTEWSHTVAKLEHVPGVLENWFFANSTHVVDMAFFLGGRPVKLSSYTKGGLDWHRAAIYAGAGITEPGAVFSYHANWCAPGRWSVEVMTSRHRLIFKPLEKLQIQEIGSVATEFVPFDETLDKDFKPGYFRQTEAFLRHDSESMLELGQFISNLSFFEQINKSAYDADI